MDPLERTGAMPLVDGRSVLPQELAGGHAGLPCVRRRPWHPRDCKPMIVREPPEKEGEPLPGADFENRPEYTSFSGTQNLPWTMARARSMGSLARGGILDKALNCRTKTDFAMLVDIFVSAARDDRPLDIRHFKQPYNPHRHTTDSAFLNPDRRRKKVLQVLQKYPLMDIYDLASVSPEYWTNISRELGGLSHDVVMRHALEHVQQVMTPMDRAAFWAAVGPRQSTNEHFRQTHFPTTDTSRVEKARYGWRREEHRSGKLPLAGRETYFQDASPLDGYTWG